MGADFSKAISQGMPVAATGKPETMSSLSILNATLPVYFMMVAGALMRKFGWLPKETDSGIVSLATRLLFPCLALERIIGNPALNNAGEVFLNASLGFGLVAIMIYVSYALTPLLGIKRGEGARTFALCTGFQNYGFVAIPVIEALFGKEYVGVLFTYSLGMEAAMWTLGVGILTGFGKAPWRHALTPPVLSIIIALILHYAGAAAYMPDSAHKLLGQLGACAIPLSVLLIGATIMDLIGTERIRWNVAISSAVLRIFVLPWILLFAAKFLPVSLEMKRIFCVQASMPAAVFTIVLARHYGGHAATAVLVILSTTVVGIFTMPFVIGFAMKWLGV
ncbi:AEC family transporter [soil metagenome]